MCENKAFVEKNLIKHSAPNCKTHLSLTTVETEIVTLSPKPLHWLLQTAGTEPSSCKKSVSHKWTSETCLLAKVYRVKSHSLLKKKKSDKIFNPRKADNSSHSADQLYLLSPPKGANTFPFFIKLASFPKGS